MLALNKTKAALQGRLSHFTNAIEENNTAISLVNLSRSAGAGNYGKSPGVTAAMPRFLSEGVRHWRSAQSPKFSGDLQSAENSADTWLSEKPADLLLNNNIPTEEISSLEQNQQVTYCPCSKNIQRHRETTATTINATIIFLRIGNQPFGTQSIFNWCLIPFSWFLNSCLITSSSEFKASYLAGIPVFFMISTAALISCGLLNSGGKMLSVSPVIKATLCLHNTVAGQSHEIPTCPATSKTTTSYRSVLLLLSAENLYSMSFFVLNKLMSVFFVQPFDSIPRLSNSRLSKRLIQPDLLSSPSSFIAAARRSDKSLSSLTCITLRSLLSVVDIVNSSELVCNGVDNVLHCMTLSKAKPGSGGTLTGPLTTTIVNVSRQL